MKSGREYVLLSINNKQLDQMSKPAKAKFIERLSEHLNQVAPLFQRESSVSYHSPESINKLGFIVDYLQENGYSTDVVIVDAIEMIEFFNLKLEEPQTKRIFEWQEYLAEERNMLLKYLIEVRNM